MKEFVIKHKDKDHAPVAGVRARSFKDAVRRLVGKGVDLSGACLDRVDLGGVMLDGAELAGASLADADLRFAHLNHADLGGANLVRTDLTGVTARGLNLAGANLGATDFSLAYLFRADLRAARLSGTFLRAANLSATDFTGADVFGVDFRVARLWEATLSGADLSNSNVTGAEFYTTGLKGVLPNWQAHDLVAAILFNAAGQDVEKRKVAGTVALSVDWCWTQFLRVSDPLTGWALGVLAAHAFEGDENLPKVVRDAAPTPLPKFRKAETTGKE